MAEGATTRPGGRPVGGTNRRPGTATTFGHALALCGLTHPEAASYLEMSVATVKAYALGSRSVPPAVMTRVADLWQLLALRAEPEGLPESVMQRRRALQDLKSRPWTAKAALTRDDLEGRVDPATAAALAVHLASRKSKADDGEDDAEEDEHDDE